MDQLNDENFLVYAMNNFSVPACLDTEEFNEELKRFRYIVRAFKIDAINTRLILNHIIVLYNIFGDAATPMLLFKVGKEHMQHLVPFLIYLNRLTIEQIDQIMITTTLNQTIIEELRNL